MMERTIKVETILNALQGRWTDALSEIERWGKDDRVAQKKVDWCIGMKLLVEELICSPVNLQLDGSVTIGGD